MEQINLSDLLSKMNLSARKTHKKEAVISSSSIPQPVLSIPEIIPQYKESVCFRIPKLFRDIRFLNDSDLVKLFGTDWKSTVFIQFKTIIPPSECCQYSIIDLDTGCKRQCRRRFTIEKEGKKRCGLHKSKGICHI